jgi:hypothetical protein
MPGIQTLQQDYFAKGFSSMEVDFGGTIFTAVVKVKYDQAMDEGWVRGTSPIPIARTEGELKEGSGSIEWALIDEAQKFVELLGNGYYRKVFNATFTYWRKDQPTVRHQLYECRILNVEDDHGQGTDALHETMPFSFRYHQRNGLNPL